MNWIKLIRNYKALALPVVAVALVTALMTSCGKTSVAPSALNIRLQVINVAPDLGPVAFYINYIRQPNTVYYYPNAAGYTYLTSLDTPYQIRTALASGVTLFQLSNDTLKKNNRYTIYLTGLQSDKSLSYIFTSDSTTAPAIGRAKVRFVNASPTATGFDIYANGTIAFSNRTFKSISDFIELPAGMYTFTVYNKGDNTNLLAQLANITVQDGRLYTVYTRGLLGHTTDTAAFTASISTNK